MIIQAGHGDGERGRCGGGGSIVVVGAIDVAVAAAFASVAAVLLIGWLHGGWCRVVM